MTSTPTAWSTMYSSTPSACMLSRQSLIRAPQPLTQANGDTLSRSRGDRKLGGVPIGRPLWFSSGQFRANLARQALHKRVSTTSSHTGTSCTLTQNSSHTEICTPLTQKSIATPPERLVRTERESARSAAHIVMGTRRRRSASRVASHHGLRHGPSRGSPCRSMHGGVACVYSMLGGVRLRPRLPRRSRFSPGRSRPGPAPVRVSVRRYISRPRVVAIATWGVSADVAVTLSAARHARL